MYVKNILKMRIFWGFEAQFLRFEDNFRPIGLKLSHHIINSSKNRWENRICGPRGPQIHMGDVKTGFQIKIQIKFIIKFYLNIKFNHQTSKINGISWMKPMKLQIFITNDEKLVPIEHKFSPKWAKFMDVRHKISWKLRK